MTIPNQNKACKKINNVIPKFFSHTLNGSLLRPCLHPSDEGGTFILPKVLVGIVEVTPHTFELILPVANVTPRNGGVDTLFIRSETTTAPTHLPQHLVTFIGRVQFLDITAQEGRSAGAVKGKILTLSTTEGIAELIFWVISEVGRLISELD